MAKQVKCPKCGTPQPLSPNCVKCNMDFKEYARRLKEKRAASAGGQKKMVRCPQCGERQPLSPNCVKCNMDFKAYARKLKEKKAAASSSAEATQVMDAPSFSGPTQAPVGAGQAGGGDVGLRDLGRLFDDSWQIYRSRFVTLFVLNIMAFVFFLAPIAVLTPLGLLGGLFGAEFAMLGMGLGAGLGVLVGAVIIFIPMAGLIAAIDDESLTIKTALSAGRARLWPYLWVMGLMGFIVGGASVLFFIPAVIAFVIFLMVQFIVVLEPDRGMNAMMKSWAYVQGRWWGVFGRLLLMTIISSALGSTLVGNLLFTPFMYVMLYLMYKDLKAEKGPDTDYPRGGWGRLKWLLIACLGYLIILGFLVMAALSNMEDLKGLPDALRAGRDNLIHSQKKSSEPGQGNPVLKSGKSTYAPGEPIVVSFSGMPGNDTDWINITPASSSDSTYRDGYWYFLKGKASGNLVFTNLAPGEYEVRAYYDWSGASGYTVRARHRVTVTGGDAAGIPDNRSVTEGMGAGTERTGEALETPEPAGNDLESSSPFDNEGKLMAWIYIYSVNYMGQLSLNGETVQEIEGEKDVQYNYNFSGDLKDGVNVFEIAYESLPEPGLLKMKIEATRSDNNEIIWTWNTTEEGGMESFEVSVD